MYEKYRFKAGFKPPGRRFFSTIFQVVVNIPGGNFWGILKGFQNAENPLSWEPIF
jgi:hypothetical protein